MGDPSAREEGLEERGAGGAGEVVPAFRPVQAASRGGASGGANAVDVDPESGEQRFTGRGDRQMVVREVQVTAGEQPVVDANRELPGEMVVARAGVCQLRGR